MRTRLTLALFTLGALALRATSDLEGQLTLSAGPLPSDLTVELHQDGRLIERTFILQSGAFRMRIAQNGSYEVRVLNGQGQLLRRDFVNVGQHMGPLQLRLDAPEKERPAHGSVSVRALMKPMPKGVQKQMRRSEQALSRGDVEGSIALLEQALETCADCPELHNNIGVRYLRLGRISESVAALRRAVAIDEHSVLALGNLAIALAALRDFQGSEAAARRALAQDRGFLPARYALGLSLISSNRCTTEAIQHLTASADQIPRARLTLAAAFECQGDRHGASELLVQYLSAPAVEHRERIEQWLARLRHAQY